MLGGGGLAHNPPVYVVHQYEGQALTSSVSILLLLFFFERKGVEFAAAVESVW